MEIFSHIMTIATSKTGVEVFLAIRNTIGTGYVQYGRSGDFGGIDLWIVPKSNKSKEELLTQLQALPFVEKVLIVALSKPVTNTELVEVRELFNSLDWDTSDVKDEELSLFLNAKLERKNTYMIDFEHRKERGREKVRIIRVEQHPHFSPEWLTHSDNEEEDLERELTITDVEIRSIVVENVMGVKPPPPPPPTSHDQAR